MKAKTIIVFFFQQMHPSTSVFSRAFLPSLITHLLKTFESGIHKAAVGEEFPSKVVVLTFLKSFLNVWLVNKKIEPSILYFNFILPLRLANVCSGWLNRAVINYFSFDYFISQHLQCCHNSLTSPPRGAIILFTFLNYFYR